MNREARIDAKNMNTDLNKNEFLTMVSKPPRG